MSTRRGQYYYFCLLFVLISLIFLPVFSQAIQAFLTYPHASYKKITQHFDDSYTHQHGLPYYTGHKGTDYDALLGTPIYAAAAGQVTKVAAGFGDGCQRNTSDGGGFGNHIIIAHPNGYYTIYAHLQKGSIKITQDQAVKAGALLGLAGSSGRTYGSDTCGTFEHLHFEVRSQRYGHHVNPYNLSTGCLFIGGCDNPQLPNVNPKSPASTYQLDHLGWLDVFKNTAPSVQHLTAGSYDGGSRAGLHTAADTLDGHIYYHEVWWDTPERENGNILDRLYKLAPFGHANRKITAMTTGNFGSGDDDILAVAFVGDDVIHFYHHQRELGSLDPHPGHPAINHLAAGDIDNDGQAELLTTVPNDDHVYIFDQWNGRTLERKVGFLDAHGGNPTISAIATMDIDSNGYDELLVATVVDDHIYEYYFDYQRAKKWWKFWQLLPQPFIKQGYLDCHGDKNSPQINPRITSLAVGKFQGQQDHLAVTTTADDHIYFYWERDLANAWNGKIFQQKKFKDAFPETEQPIIHTLAAGDFDDSGDDELALAITGSDHLNFFGHSDGSGYTGYGGEEDYYSAELVAQSTKEIILRPGQISNIWVEFKNTGNVPWLKNFTPEFQLRLDPDNRNSIFYDSSWTQKNSPARLSDPEVEVGATTRFHFKVQAPIYSGQYVEYFRLHLGNQGFDQAVMQLNIAVDGELPSKISSLHANLKNSHWQQNYTNDDTPTFQWSPAHDRLSGLAGYYLAIDDPTPDGVHKQDWWIDNVTTWTAPTSLVNGWHTVAITAKDKAGNVNPANTDRLGDAPYLKFMTDTEAPVPPPAISPDTTRSSWRKIRYYDGREKNITTSRQPAFIWSAGSDKHSGINSYQIEVLNQKLEKIKDLILKTATNGSTTWQYPDVLSDGEYILKIKTVDRAGNFSTIIAYSFAVDTTPPTGSVTINRNNKYTANDEVTLEIITKDSSLVTAYSLSADSQAWQTFTLKNGYRPTINYSTPWQLVSGNGTRTVFIKFRDSCGHWSQPFTDSIILDTTKPNSRVNDLPTWHNTLSFFVSWFGQDNLSGIKYFDVQYKDSLTKKWITWLSKTKLEGKLFTGLNGVTYWFRSRAYNQINNQENYPRESDTETIVDITKPDPPIINDPADNSNFSASVDEDEKTAGIQKTISGTAETGSQIILVLKNDTLRIKHKYSAKVDVQGNWTINGVVLTEGENIIQTTAIDPAGNWNDSGDHSIWLDTIAPAVITDLAASNTTYHSTVLSWITPGDDGQQGTTKLYDIRYSLQPLTITNFASARLVAKIPVPGKAGNKQSLAVDGLEPKETYYFAIKAVDEVENWSDISNTVTAQTTTSANSITLTTSKNTLTAESSQQSTLTATVYNPDNKTGSKLAGEPITLMITKNNGHLGQTGSISAIRDNGNGTYSSIYIAAGAVGNGQITITADCSTCMSQPMASIDIKLVPGYPAGEIKLNARPAQINANGFNTTSITSQTITDKTGNPVADGEMITVNTQQGSIITPDADAIQLGTQVITQKGIIQFVIRSPQWNSYDQSNTQVAITAKSATGSAQGQTKVTFRDVTTPPTPIITTPAHISFTNNNTPTITGQAEPKARLLIYCNNKYHHYTYADSAGKFSYTFGKALDDNQYELKIRARDTAGNTSDYSENINILIDTVAPIITSYDPTDIVHHRHNNIVVNYHDNPGGTGIDINRTKLSFHSSAMLISASSALSQYNRTLATTPGNVSDSQASYNVTLAEENRTYHAQATVVDRAGNITAVNWTFTVQLFTYLKSRVESGYRSSIVSNWSDSKGLISSPDWWSPSFADNTWRDIVYLAQLPPTSILKPETNSEWLWGDPQVDPNETTLIRKRFAVPNNVIIDDAAIRMSADNEAWGFVGFLNGYYFGKVPEALSEGNPYLFGVKNLIRPGNNLLAIQVSNGNDNRAGIAYTMTIKYHD
ncbi:peptidoglycan DD-metalloendopeptidase family protein [Patescibacteria group bacterium]|nr:peptidoglycan DD-metalloendopeptidase family protein [Patescibacteria group bacterium]